MKNRITQETLAPYAIDMYEVLCCIDRCNVKDPEEWVKNVDGLVFDILCNIDVGLIADSLKAGNPKPLDGGGEE